MSQFLFRNLCTPVPILVCWHEKRLIFLHANTIYQRNFVYVDITSYTDVYQRNFVYVGITSYTDVIHICCALPGHNFHQLAVFTVQKKYIVYQFDLKCLWLKFCYFVPLCRPSRLCVLVIETQIVIGDALHFVFLFVVIVGNNEIIYSTQQYPNKIWRKLERKAPSACRRFYTLTGYKLLRLSLYYLYMIGKNCLILCDFTDRFYLLITTIARHVWDIYVYAMGYSYLIVMKWKQYTSIIV